LKELDSTGKETEMNRTIRNAAIGLCAVAGAGLLAGCRSEAGQHADSGEHAERVFITAPVYKTYAVAYGAKWKAVYISKTDTHGRAHFFKVNYDETGAKTGEEPVDVAGKGELYLGSVSVEGYFEDGKFYWNYSEKVLNGLKTETKTGTISGKEITLKSSYYGTSSVVKYDSLTDENYMPPDFVFHNTNEYLPKNAQNESLRKFVLIEVPAAAETETPVR
jgi:hypothetical protein